MGAGIPDVSEHALAAAAAALLVVSTVLVGLVALAAVGLNRWAWWSERRRVAREARWTPRLLGLLDGEIAPESFASGLRRGQRADMLRFLITYAVRLRAADRQRLAKAAAPLLPYARRRLASWSPERRAFAVRALGLLSVRTPLVTLGTALRDPSRRVALAAARALAQSRSPRAAPIMLTGLSRFGGAHTANVASLLAQFGLRAGAPITAALVHPRTDARARVAAIEALRQLSYVPAAEPARALLESPRLDAEVKGAVLRLLAEVGGAREAAAVRPFVDSSEDILRIHAVGALGRLQCGPEDAVRLRRALRDPNVWVARQASEALGQPVPRPTPPRVQPVPSEASS
ncbi:HEAT repeat domain-containing protein [Rubrivirga marina]|uniref:HEAT repeat domain-containing protein n=1 Tax=Rubrivirga marina TaxID=1196024 RepID=A0A271IY30_9BACT|nr:HEAT repeat domain-containing protein [Rubrivirga marina]PAP76161.1 hypothetical protein BSZ37_06725 [Rubrivirga marina]